MRFLAGLLSIWIGTAAAQTIVLRSPQLEVVLGKDRGLPSEYRLRSNQGAIHGAEPEQDVTATIFEAHTHQFQEVKLQPRDVRTTPTRADFSFTAKRDGVSAASFVLRYELRAATLTVSLEDIQENAGYELIDVATPDLASIHEEDGAGWIAHGETGGNLIRLAEAKPGRLAPNRFWFGVAATLPVAMIGTARALCVEEVTALMDTTELAVAGEPGHRRAELGTIAAHRVNGSLAWDMNAEPGKPRIAGNTHTPNLLIEQQPVARLDFAADYDGNGVVDWLDAAKIVRTRMPPIPTHYYDDRLPYMVHVDEPRWPAPRTTFAQTSTLVRQVAMLTAYAPQDVYLWGWQFRGKDTGYPAVDVVNERAGGRDGLLKLMADGREVNANVSFSDNFDDAYKSSPAWEAKYIARQPDGELWESRIWTGEVSYILGLAKYMAGPGPERVRSTCKEYPLKDTYLIDVLSYYPIRNDWDPEHPASGIRNLTEGRFKVLDEFKKCGLDIVSEQLRYAFIGKNSVNDNGPTGGPSPFGGEPIPLAATIYRHSAIWGLSGQNWREAPEIYTLFYNGHQFFGGPETPEGLAAFYYGIMVPWYQVHYREVESYRREGDRTVIGLEGNSKIDIDWKNSLYTVVVAGIEVAKNGDTFCPVGDDRIAFYSKKGGRLSAPLPHGWDRRGIAALELYADHAGNAHVSQTDDRLTVDAPAGRPIIVFRDGVPIGRAATPD
jgi:hypothetical protein